MFWVEPSFGVALFFVQNGFFLYITIMIVINKGQTQTMVMTLTEMSTLTSPTYLFCFTSDITGNSVNFIAHDISPVVERYNEFTITETTGTNILTSGTITLSPTGTWSYKVLEQTSTTNLNPLLADNQTPVEIGQIRVIGTNVEFVGYSGQDTTIKSYGTGS